MEWIKPLAAKIEKSETDTQPELELWPTGYERTSPLNHLLTTTHKPMQYFKQKNAFKEPCLWIISCNRIATETNAWKGNQVSWGMQLTEPLQSWHLTVGLPLQMLKATALRSHRVTHGPTNSQHWENVGPCKKLARFPFSFADGNSELNSSCTLKICAFSLRQTIIQPNNIRLVNDLAFLILTPSLYHLTQPDLLLFLTEILKKNQTKPNQKAIKAHNRY